MSAREKAKHSCYDQIVWIDSAGVRREGRVTAETVKAALLASGTKGRFTVYSAHGRGGHIVNWQIGINYLANLKRGFYCHG